MNTKNKPSMSIRKRLLLIVLIFYALLVSVNYVVKQVRSQTGKQVKQKIIAANEDIRKSSHLLRHSLP